MAWVRGMKARQLQYKVEIMPKYERWPNIIVVHCDGNDIDQIPLGDLRNLIQIIQLNKIKGLLPYTRIVWSQILHRNKWRYSINNKAMERSKKKNE